SFICCLLFVLTWAKPLASIFANGGARGGEKSLWLLLGDPNLGLASNIAKPKLFIHRRCARLIECLPALQHDPNRPEDVLKVDADEDGDGGDDTGDCLRYLVATKERKVTQRKLRGL